MRIVIVWSIAITLWFTLTLVWLFTLPISFALSATIEAQVAGTPALTPLRIIELVAIIWGPLWDLFILGWAISESQRQDIASTMHR